VKINKEDILKLHRKHRRENTVRIKPMVTTDKKKKEDKERCRKFKVFKDLWQT